MTDDPKAREHANNAMAEATERTRQPTERDEVSAAVEDAAPVAVPVVEAAEGEKEAETSTAKQVTERLSSHLDMLAETVRAIVTNVMQPEEVGDVPDADAVEEQEGVESRVPRSEYPLETRQKCMELHEAGRTLRQIATELNMPITSVQTIIKRAKQSGGVQPAQRTGRPRATDSSFEQAIMDMVREDPTLSARVIEEKLRTTMEHANVSVSFETIRRRVRECRKQLYATLNEGAIEEAVANAVDDDGPAFDGGADENGGGDLDPDQAQGEAPDSGAAGRRLPAIRRKRGSEYTPEFRELCVLKHEKEGKSYQTIAAELNVPHDSVRAIVRKAKRTGSVVTAPRSGRPRKTTDLIDRVILQSVKNSQRSTAKQIQEDLLTIYQIDVSCETIRRRVRDHTKQRLAESTTPAVQVAPSATVPTTTKTNAPSVTRSKTPSRSQRATAATTTDATSSRKRKRNEYSVEVRERCVELHGQGIGYRKIGEELQMPHTTVRAIVEKAQRTGTVLPAPRSGRPRKTDEILDKVILQTVKANAKCPARVIQEELESAYNVSVSCETIRRRVKEHMHQKHKFAESTNTHPGGSVPSTDDDAATDSSFAAAVSNASPHEATMALAIDSTSSMRMPQSIAELMSGVTTGLPHMVMSHLPSSSGFLAPAEFAFSQMQEPRSASSTSISADASTAIGEFVL
ncbi:hypothetical protein Poli38472_007980 [Pythium oligandrum]|uniref:Sleeping Beauty transposase HTH domain-containing protein n=1 Tax=Pythium oligandrum TaxID=41045 RepID=A0A8K1FP71_PYTOL|nr:hypothetical protein Poli38472_007980 [Pythium oligandrum]|eukprot:TMW65338.1 hypothetical protein Poli38472_007980 [Pythium oligandrum]